MTSGGEETAAHHRQPSPKHTDRMLGSLLVVIVAVASATGMHFSYDGTPLADGVVIGGGVSSSVPVVGSVPQPAARVVSGPVDVAPFRQQNFVPGLASSTFQQTFPAVSPVLPPPAPTVPSMRGGPRGCSYPLGTVVHESFNGRDYHLSWCSQPGRTFSFQQAESFCRSIGTDGHPTGFHAVSLESQVEDSFITSIISHYEVPYIWTSGYKVGPYSWKWQSCVASQYSRWSHTGRFGRSQPDNADMNENCLAILNNFYGDGIIWHDIDCSLEKYVICERPSLRAH